MMSVLEYALDINRNVDDVLSKLNYLGYDITNENDLLDQEIIVKLDYSFESDDVDEQIDEEVLKH